MPPDRNRDQLELRSVCFARKVMLCHLKWWRFWLFITLHLFVVRFKVFLATCSIRIYDDSFDNLGQSCLSTCLHAHTARGMFPVFRLKCFIAKRML
jgi:hypothetical protein